MKQKQRCILILLLVLDLSFNAFSQVPAVPDVDSLQKSILESVRKSLDSKTFSHPYFDTSKIFGGKSPVDLDKIFKEIDKDLRLAKLQGDIDKVENGYHHLSKLDSIRGNYKGAYENYKLYSLYRDSLQKKETEKRELQAKMQYEFDKKQAIAKAEQEKKDAEARRVKNIQYFTIAGLVILVLVILLIALIQGRNSKQRKNANILLQSEKERVESTLSELKSTQTQLIQSEKMASLGELTAGIAHEIQNPLNFVNNFSEVNSELISEMVDEVDKGNVADAKAIANDIKQNLEKINHHGKRADAIVKGMLQHSRIGSGIKEPTDINALADEYLRLAYHGLQARDKDFGATMKTDFDKNIGNINIVPQDMGRVLQNLISNAFYAVGEKKRNTLSNPAAGEYEPMIMVSTSGNNGNVEIKIKDNGNGIPQNIIDKIFQPFFTTKPTGEGTGLGLSLAYDIVTKGHGGELKVETKQNEGSAFIIKLPAG